MCARKGQRTTSAFLPSSDAASNCGTVRGPGTEGYHSNLRLPAAAGPTSSKSDRSTKKKEEKKSWNVDSFQLCSSEEHLRGMDHDEDDDVRPAPFHYDYGEEDGDEDLPALSPPQIK